MKLFRRKKKAGLDPLEQRLDTISELTKGLGKKEFNCLMDAVKSVFEARQKLLGVKTDEEKENAEFDEADRVLNKEKENRWN